ncbi:hypothetical protein JL107_17540 [Nakamurella flavida]|uniref:Uncharacterized protein n=1 Tax=Nakamurella flavida TaxID=363630 RepID=A0A938YSV5_9ACTN|nr:hypothetical protein [Nakamurella flavida]MBM9478255.1 hypothetical protein [Nakamurella flavida]MDP9777574.1 hypothetical protein [Nakamurella flavida]
MSFMKKFTSIGGLIALAQSPAGKKAIAKAQQLASDPKNKQKIADLTSKITKRGQTPPPAAR